MKKGGAVIKKVKDIIKMMKISVKYYHFKITNDKETQFYKSLQVSSDEHDYLKASIDEYENLKDKIGSPKTILDIGCGIGRSSVFFKNMLQLNDTMFYLADFDSNEQYKLGRSKCTDGIS